MLETEAKTFPTLQNTSLLGEHFPLCARVLSRLREYVFRSPRNQTTSVLGYPRFPSPRLGGRRLSVCKAGISVSYLGHYRLLYWRVPFVLKTRKSTETRVSAYVWGDSFPAVLSSETSRAGKCGQRQCPETGSAQPEPGRGVPTRPGDRRPQRTQGPAGTACARLAAPPGSIPHRGTRGHPELT